MIKKKLGLKIDDLEELKEDLNKKIEDSDLFVYRGKGYLSNIVGSIKSYEVEEDGTAEFTIRPLMEGYGEIIEKADMLELSIEEGEESTLRKLILVKDGKYI